MRRFAADAGVALAVALAIGVIAGHSYPDYDTTFSLIWGRDVAHGVDPNYDLPFRPAAHPLIVAFAAVASVLGEAGAADLVRWVVLIGAGALVAGVFRLGQALFGTGVGVVAALILFTRTPVWSYSELAYVDVPAAALVVWAAVLAVRAVTNGDSLRLSRRGELAALGLLGVAGLLRPEVWLLAGVYAAWLIARSPRRAPLIVALAAAAPAAWIAWDAVVSGGFLSSLHSENAPAAPSSGGTGLGAAPEALVRDLGGFLRPPAVLAGLFGAIAALALVRGRAVLPIALGVLNGVAFFIVAAGGGPLEQRYLFPAAAMLALFAALSAATLARDSSLGLGWRVPALLGALALVAYLPVDVDRLRDLRAQVRAADESQTELRQAVERCGKPGRVHVPDVRLRPFVAYWGDIAPERVGTEPDGVSVEPLDPVARELVSRSLPRTTDGNGPAESWRIHGCPGQ